MHLSVYSFRSCSFELLIMIMPYVFAFRDRASGRCHGGRRRDPVLPWQIRVLSKFWEGGPVIDIIQYKRRSTITIVAVGPSRGPAGPQYRRCVLAGSHDLSVTAERAGASAADVKNDTITHWKPFQGACIAVRVPNPSTVSSSDSAPTMSSRSALRSQARNDWVRIVYFLHYTAFHNDLRGLISPCDSE